MIYQFRCELCDDFLPMFQMSKLCPTCYKIRTIIKCYNNEMILDKLNDTFIVNEKIGYKWEKDANGKWIKKNVINIKNDNDADESTA